MRRFWALSRRELLGGAAALSAGAWPAGRALASPDETASVDRATVFSTCANGFLDLGPGALPLGPGERVVRLGGRDVPATLLGLRVRSGSLAPGERLAGARSGASALILDLRDGGEDADLVAVLGDERGDVFEPGETAAVEDRPISAEVVFAARAEGLRVVHLDGWTTHVYADLGNFQFVPGNAFDHLDPGESVAVAIPWRRSGDRRDRALVVRIEAPEGLGRDLARGARLAPEGAAWRLALAEPVPDGAVLDVSFRLSGPTRGAVRVGLGAAQGRPVSGQGPTSDSLRAQGRVDALVFTADDLRDLERVEAVRARMLLDDGPPAAIDLLRASRRGDELDGDRLDLDWGVEPAAGWPAFPAVDPNPDIQNAYDDQRGAVHRDDGDRTPYRVLYPYKDPARQNVANWRAVSCAFEGFSSLYASAGYQNVHLRDVVWTGPVPDLAIPPEDSPDYAAFREGRVLGVWRASAAGPDFRIGGDALCFVSGLRIETGMIPYLDRHDLWARSYVSLINIDYSGRWDVGAERLLLVNVYGEGATDSLVDGKSGYTLLFAAVGRVKRPVRIWDGAAVVAHFREEAPPVQQMTGGRPVSVNKNYENGAMLIWRYRAADGRMVRTAAELGLDLRYRGHDTDGSAIVVTHLRPRLAPAARVNATDFEAEASADGVSWAALDIEAGTNDAIGALRRRAVPAAPGQRRVRIRARWGRHAGPWLEVDVVDDREGRVSNDSIN